MMTSMRATVRSLAVLAALAAAGAGAPALAFEPTGEMSFFPQGGVGSTASFDAQTVVGPIVNLTEQDGGGWAGDLDGENIDLALDDGHLTGVNVNLWLRTRAGRTEIEGLFFGLRVHLELDGKRLKGRFGACSLDLARKRPGYYYGDVGCMSGRPQVLPTTAKATLQLSGEAAADRPPLPQFAFALLAILPS